jgi:hypothetical protein
MRIGIGLHEERGWSSGKAQLCLRKISWKKRSRTKEFPIESELLSQAKGDCAANSSSRNLPDLREYLQPEFALGICGVELFLRVICHVSRNGHSV